MLREKILTWRVAIPVKNLDKSRQIPASVIAKTLLKQLSTIKANKHGYLLAVTKLISIGQGDSKSSSQDVVLFPVKFCCKILKPVADDVMMGVVYKVYRHGVFLKSGPMNMIYLSAQKMADYHYANGENPSYVREDSSKIEMGVLVRFRVLAARWKEDEQKEFRVLARIDADGLGPVSLSGPDGIID